MLAEMKREILTMYQLDNEFITKLLAVTYGRRNHFYINDILIMSNGGIYFKRSILDCIYMISNFTFVVTLLM